MRRRKKPGKALRQPRRELPLAAWMVVLGALKALRDELRLEL